MTVTLRRNLVAYLLNAGGFVLFSLIFLVMFAAGFGDPRNRADPLHWVAVVVCMYAPLAALFGPVRICGCELRYGMWPFRKRQSFAEIERFDVIRDFPGVRASSTTGIAFFLRSSPVRQFLTGSEYLRASVRERWVRILEETRARCVSEDVD